MAHFKEGSTSHIEECNHSSFLLTAGSRLDLVMRNHVLENTDENEQGRTMRENMKISLSVSLPTSETVSVLCGGNKRLYEFMGLNRQQFVGRYAGENVRFVFSETANEMRKAIMDIDSTSEVMIAMDALVPGTMVMGYAVPLNVDGKICVVGCAIRMMNQAAAVGRRWNRTEIECALKVVNAFKHKVCKTEDSIRFARANVREYFLVDYPRKFLWHDSLFTVKNTFLHIKSPYPMESALIRWGDADECVARDEMINDTNPIKLVYLANEDNLKLIMEKIKSLCCSMALVGEPHSFYAPVDPPCESTISARRQMPTTVPIVSRRSCCNTIVPRERAFPGRVQSYSNEIFEARSPRTKKPANKNVEESEDARDLLEESYTGDFGSFNGSRFLNSVPCVEGHESQHFIPSYAQSPTSLRVENHASPSEEITSCPTIVPSNDELFRCSTYDSASNAAPDPSKQRELIKGDHVELHSFPRASWMCGLKARVKYVIKGEMRRENRPWRVRIEYDQPEFQKNPLYANAVPYTNVRLIDEEKE